MSVREFMMRSQPLRRQAAVELSTAASRQPRTNPSDLVTRRPFRTAGHASCHRVQETQYHLRVSSEMSPTGHPRDDQTLSRLLRVGAYRRAEAYTSRPVRCVRRIGQEKVCSCKGESPKEFGGSREGY